MRTYISAVPITLAIPILRSSFGRSPVLSPPVYNPTALGQYATSLAPRSARYWTDAASPQPGLQSGIDPSTLPGVPANIVTDLKKYIYTDINGKARPQGGGSDLGAYQH